MINNSNMKNGVMKTRQKNNNNNTGARKIIEAKPPHEAKYKTVA